MTRVIVYSIALVAFIAATAMTLSSILLPTWITYTAKSSSNPGHPSTTFSKSIGLHRSCTSTSATCSHFPQYEDCHGTDRYFCSMWRSVGFMMSLVFVLELVTLVAYSVVIIGGRQKRETGWKVIGFLLAIVGVLQCACMALVAYLFDYDERFIEGWELDNAWILCTISWCIAVLSAAFISLSAFVFPSEGGYELIPSERHGG